MLPRQRSKKHSLKWLENIIQIEIPILLLRTNLQVFQKPIRHFLMTKREKCMINMEWELMNRNNMKIWDFREIADLVDLEILAIFGVNNSNKEVLKTYSMILRIFFLSGDKKKIQIDQKEDWT